MTNQDRQAEIRQFYDTVYHTQVLAECQPSAHQRRLARRLQRRADQQVLDVACGTGAFLRACSELGNSVAGIDLSDNAIATCRNNLPHGEFHTGNAETLPFEDQRFDLVTCLGSLEHFLEPVKALREMVRVAKPQAQFVILVPNAGFLTRRLGLYGGTQQTDALEEVRSLVEWGRLFEEAGLRFVHRWKDLHVLSWRWISAGNPTAIPLRALQALLLPLWPLRWQYQVYHLVQRA